MASEDPSGPFTPSNPTPRIRVPLSRSRHRLSFERRLRLWFYLPGVLILALCWLLLRQYSVAPPLQLVILAIVAIGSFFAISLLMEQIVRPMQTLANVVAALREDDFSFRARGGQRNDAIGDLALEINRLAGTLQSQRAGALEAMALVERVMHSMRSPVLAFDPEGRLKMLNAAAEQAFELRPHTALGQTAPQLNMQRLLDVPGDDVISLGNGQHTARWMIKRSSFRLRGVPHTLFVLSDVSAALREEERIAWERLIRVLGHEINNSLTPIKSIAGSLRVRLPALTPPSEERGDFERGLEVIENRSESLNRFLQAYRQLMRLPAPQYKTVSLSALIARVAQLERRVPVTVTISDDVILRIDPDQVEQALINLLRNAADAALSPDAPNHAAPQVEVQWQSLGAQIVLSIYDNGPGLRNQSNLFVPFYTTKPGGTGIGLVLAQQIAQAHHGSVQVENRSDGQSGCRADLRLPLTE
jgi:nitrogen fixation/metabolism regulation signal transduction histidine kinase